MSPGSDATSTFGWSRKVLNRGRSGEGIRGGVPCPDTYGPRLRRILRFTGDKYLQKKEA